MREILLNARKEKGLTQEQVARACQIARVYYTAIENGSRGCSVNVAKRIGAVLGVPWEKIFE